MRPAERLHPSSWVRGVLAVAAVLGLATAVAGCGSSPAPDESAATSTSTVVPEISPVPAVTPPLPVAPVLLPVPIAPPDPEAWEPYVGLGTIEIPKLGLRVAMAEGITLGTLAKGPGHWPGSAMPGEVGNVVVAGHRVTHSRPFRNIHQLVVGDEVVFEVSGRRHVYRVDGTDVVPPTGIEIIDQTPARTATLFACHPPGSARYRYVVHLELVT